VVAVGDDYRRRGIRRGARDVARRAPNPVCRGQAAAGVGGDLAFNAGIQLDDRISARPQDRSPKGRGNQFPRAGDRCRCPGFIDARRLAIRVFGTHPTVTERTTHNLLYLLHTGLVGLSGLAGTVVLWRALVRLTGDTAKAARVFVIWLATFSIVGGEVAWALRPFVGSIYHPVAFLRADMLDGNVYEFIIRDIVPHLLSEF
jgi:hypothetical protein